MLEKITNFDFCGTGDFNIDELGDLSNRFALTVYK